MTHGRMMDFPLTLTHFVTRAAQQFPKSKIVSRLCDGSIHRETHGDFARRAKLLASALQKLGVKKGERVATLMWNNHRHLEAYFAAPCMGAVLHTLNLRLHPNEIGYIAAHGEDKVVIVDESLLPLFEKFRAQIPTLKTVIVASKGQGKYEGDAGLDYETVLESGDPAFDFATISDERDEAMICYTSGTTGNPKGVLYSHRSLALHSMATLFADGLGMGERDVVLPVVPMFHANAWGLCHGVIGCGADMVFPGPKLDGESILDLIQMEKV
ncbi:MAG TPA: AMP-binding protein, partial [Polyangiaceae bacterium]